MTTPAPQRPTDQWRAAAPDLPALDTAAADTAERLLLLVHYDIDWTSWIADHRPRYWDHLLPQRIHAATYRADSLYTWWSLVTTSLNIVIRTSERRTEVAALLAHPSAPVLTALRDNLPALILRVRITAESVAAQTKAHGDA